MRTFISILATLLTLVLLVSCNGNKEDPIEPVVEDEIADETVDIVYTDDTMEPIYCPWDDGGKQPSEYTWDEFNALTGPQQIMFQKTFADIDEFDVWLQKAQGNEPELIPWENGGKLPPEYTWDEFNALSGELQMKFQYYFGDIDEFDKWLTANQPQ